MTYLVTTETVYDRPIFEREGVEMMTVRSHVMITVQYKNGEVKTQNYTEAVAKNGYYIRNLWPGSKDYEKISAAYTNAGHKIMKIENYAKDVAVPQKSQADLDEEKYVRERNAIYRMSAGGEKCDAIFEDVDKTPRNKSDC